MSRVSKAGGGGPPAWAPSDIAGLRLWLDPSDTAKRVINASLFDSITCKKSGVVYTGAGTTKPKLGLPADANGGWLKREYLNFGLGENRILQSAAGSMTIAAAAGIHVFAAMYWGTNTGTYRSLSLQKGGATNAISGSGAVPFVSALTASASAARFQAAYSANDYTYSANTFTQGQAALYEMQFAALPVNTTFWKNGVSVARGAYAGSTALANLELTGIGSSDTTYMANGGFGEILVYEGILSADNITKVRDYLNSRWGFVAPV